MTKKLTVLISACVAMVLVALAACAPSGAPAPRVTPGPAQAAAPESPAKPVAVAGPEEAAWAKVVEAARKEGTVTLYSFGFVSDLGITLSRAFRDRYGIALELITGTGSQLMPRIQSEHRAGQFVADILEGASTNGLLAKREGLSQPYGNLPVFQAKDVWALDPRFDPEGHVLYYSPVIVTPWANTKLVKPEEEPRVWRDMLNPRWKGNKIVVIDPDSMPSPNMYYVMLTRYLGFDDKYFEDVGKQGLRFAATQRDNDAILARGEAAISLSSVMATIGPFVLEGAPVKPLAMEDGVPARGLAVNLIKDAPHPNAARLFMNWILSEEGQLVHNQIRAVMSIRKDVSDFTPPAARMALKKVLLVTPKDEEDSASVQRQKVLSKLWKK